MTLTCCISSAVDRDCQADGRRRINLNRRSLFVMPALDFEALLYFQSKTCISSSCSMLSKLDRTPSSRADLKCKIRRIRTGVDMIDDGLSVCIHWSPYFTVIVSQLFDIFQDRHFETHHTNRRQYTGCRQQRNGWSGKLDTRQTQRRSATSHTPPDKRG
jgi:hypothetical protein